MALICTCGTELPDNARFCHQCGKPQREEDVVVTPEPLHPELLPPLAHPVSPPINFSNPVAVRVAVLCASMSALLNFLPLISLGCCLWITGAGFFSAVLYARRTGVLLSSSQGARLGWLTGLLTFVMTLVLTAVNFVMLRSGGGFREALRRSMERISAQDQITQQVLDFLTSPAGLTVFLLGYIVLGFIFIASLCIAGGALGAKVMEKE